MNVSTTAPDAIFIMQGQFVFNNTLGSKFFGKVLFGIQDGGAWFEIEDNLTAITGNALRRSRRHPSLLCSSLQANLTTGQFERIYNGITTGSQSELLGSILNFTGNWITGFGTCPTTSPFTILASTPVIQWTGAVDTNWFNCNNWSTRSVPDFNDNVLVESTASRDAVIDHTAPFSDIFQDRAQTRNLTINGRRVVLEGSPNNVLEVHRDLIIGAGGVLDMNDGNNATLDGRLLLYRNWTNNGTHANFEAGNGTVVFTGSTPQIINNVAPTGTEQFHHVELNNNFDTAVSNNLWANGNLVVNLGRTLRVHPNGYVHVDSGLTAIGSVIIEANGQLIQVNDTNTNVGTNVTVRRETLMRRRDYVYWSSPVENFAVTAISPGTPLSLIWKWIPTIGGNFGNWTNANEVMEAGKGYIVRGPSSFPNDVPALFQTAFTGRPHSGLIQVPVSRGTYAGPGYVNPANGVTVTNMDDNFNLVGNPYPSAINALSFLTQNPNIEGAVRIWTHGSLPVTTASNPFYGNFVYNYDVNDYIIYNGTGTISGPAGFNGNIASGQGFFIALLDGPTALTTTVTFRNNMRSRLFQNNQFYRMAQPPAAIDQAWEPKRIWLDILRGNEFAARTLVGYVEDATDGWDRLFDAHHKGGGVTELYSRVEEQSMCIQGRALPFMPQDRVPLGVRISHPGNYTLAIAHLEGFENAQQIFIEDTLLQIIHDIKTEPYEFTSESGIFNERFVLRYINETLSIDVPTLQTEDLIITTPAQGITIHSQTYPIESVEVFNLLGQRLYSSQPENNPLEVTLPLHPKQQTLMITVGYDGGKKITKKVIF